MGDWGLVMNNYSDRCAYSPHRLLICPYCRDVGGAFYIAQTDRFGVTHESEGSNCKHYIGPRTVKDRLKMLEGQREIGVVLLDDLNSPYLPKRHNKLIRDMEIEKRRRMPVNRKMVWPKEGLFLFGK
jgi:hypothetical protein